MGALAQDLIELVHALRDASFRSMVHAPLILLGHLLVGYGSAYCCTAYLVPLEVRPWISTVLFDLHLLILLAPANGHDHCSVPEARLVSRMNSSALARRGASTMAAEQQLTEALLLRSKS